jgi:peptidoglycan hydrolase CwlO-like protein
MDWFQSKTTQIIALVGIVGTLAGFGYTGAEYVNRLENLESKIGGISEAEDNVKIIEERFASIETSVQFLEKEIDNIQVPDVTEIKTDIATIIADLQSLNNNLEKLETKLEKKDDNPLSG